MIERNRSPYGPSANLVFGLAQIADGLIRVLSLGFFHGNHRFTPVSVAGMLMKRWLNKRRGTSP